MRPRFEIHLLTEDSSGGTWRGLKIVVGKLFRRFEDDGFTPRISIAPAEDNHRPILFANRWRSAQAKDEPAKRELWKYIARVISDPRGYVLFHYDGDTTWSSRERAESIEKFRAARTHVTQALHNGKHPLTGAEVDRRLARLIECVPFYSSEAWMYQATERAIALSRAKHDGKDVDKFEAWALDRAALDDVWQPKNATNLRDHYNEDLANHVRVRDVVTAGCSMTWLLWSLHACKELEDALDVAT